jgi:acid phosphatase type 7
MILRIHLAAWLLILSTHILAETRFVRAVFNSDASKAITIIWDQKSGANQVLLYDTILPTDFNFRFSASVSVSRQAKGMNNQIVRLNGLNSNTRYYFCIKDSEGYSRIYHTSTTPGNPDSPLSFIAGGDSRDRRVVRQKANSLVPKLVAHAVLFNGDFIGIDIEKQWLDWFEDWELSTGEDGRITPLVVTRGNHEITNKVFVDLFDVPHKKVFYSTTFGGDLLHIVSLNSEIIKFGQQKIFLRSALKEHKDYIWQIAQYHRPIRSHVGHKKEMETQYRNFVPLFEKYPNLKLCLENDSHTCKTTWPIVSDKGLGSEEGFKRDDAKGIVYVGEGCWGAPLRAADDLKCWTRDAEAINQFNWIFVSKDKIEVRTVKYENAAVVGQLTEETRFTMPDNIDLWNPSNGAVVIIGKSY